MIDENLNHITALRSLNHDVVNKLIQFRDSGAVERYHVMRKHRIQTVAEHSHGVATLVMLVAPDCRAVLLKAALTHDFHERSTGDMPSTAKRTYPDLKAAMDAAEEMWERREGLRWELTPEEGEILRYCDYLELLAWSMEEVYLGNRYAFEPALNIITALEKIDPPVAGAASIFWVLRAEVKALADTQIMPRFETWK